MLVGNFIASAAGGSVIVQTIIDYLKLHVLDKIINPDSPMYDFVVRGLVFALNLLASAIGFVLAGGTLSGAWALILAGFAGTGIALGRFHVNKYITAQRAINNAPVIPLMSPASYINITPPVLPSPSGKMEV